MIKVVAGVMAFKTFAQSNSGTGSCRYGSGLKAARATWKKDGTKLGNLVINPLFISI